LTSPVDAPTPAVTNIGCPTEIVSAVDFFASLRRLDTQQSSINSVDASALGQTLQRLHNFDVASWAAHVASTGRYAVTLASLQHLGSIWKLAAEMYACRIRRSIVGSPDASTSTSTLASTSTSATVDLLIAESALLYRHDATLIKCLIWPTFIAGLASGRLAQRRWALDTLDRIWQLTLSANARNAALVLSSLWEKQDQRSVYEQGGEVETVADWDWLNELALLEDAWLFI
jgi:hypothetical protein